MAETDISHEFGREPGFSSSGFGPERSHMLHTCFPKFLKILASRTCSTFSAFFTISEHQEKNFKKEIY